MCGRYRSEELTTPLCLLIESTQTAAICQEFSQGSLRILKIDLARFAGTGAVCGVQSSQRSTVPSALPDLPKGTTTRVPASSRRAKDTSKAFPQHPPLHKLRPRFRQSRRPKANESSSVPSHNHDMAVFSHLTLHNCFPAPQRCFFPTIRPPHADSAHSKKAAQTTWRSRRPTAIRRSFSHRQASEGGRREMSFACPL